MLEDENTPKKESYKKGIDIEKYKDKIKITEIVLKKFNIRLNYLGAYCFS